MIEQFSSHVNMFSLLPSYQSAYHPFHSYETAPVKLYNDLLWAMEHQHVTTVLSLDLSAAFDTVDHGILHNILAEQFSVSGKCLDWFNSYLHDRTCSMTVRNAVSPPVKLPFSVPQGSCLGLILFTVYASSLSTCIPPNCDLHGYADDHAVKFIFDPRKQGMEQDTLDRISETMLSIGKWINMNRLKINATKTEFTYFGSRRMLEHTMSTSCQVLGV